MDTLAIDRILEKYEFRHPYIIGIMQEVQHIENFLPEEALRYISRRMEISLTKIFDIATFYKAFSLNPRGRHVIKACCGTACHLGGAAQNLEQIHRILHVKEGETTDDRMFSVETVNCLGACALAPVVVVDDEYHEAVNAGKIEKILSSCRKEEGDG
jgi:NADH-quinone oxidoreductase subunit E